MALRSGVEVVSEGSCVELVGMGMGRGAGVLLSLLGSIGGEVADERRGRSGAAGVEVGGVVDAEEDGARGEAVAGAVAGIVEGDVPGFVASAIVSDVIDVGDWVV